MDPATAALLGGGGPSYDLGSGPAQSASRGGHVGTTGVNVGGLTVNKSSWSTLAIAALLGGAMVWLAKS